MCLADGTPKPVELKIDGKCNKVMVPDGDGEKEVFYKANPVPPDPRCMAKYEEFKDEQSCLDGTALPDGDASLVFPNYVGDANAVNYVHNTCVAAAPDSRRIDC